MLAQRTSWLAASAALAFFSPASAQVCDSNWIDFVDESTTRLFPPSVANIGKAGTPEEGDFDMVVCDVDLDGWDDVIAVRMGLNYFGPLPNLFLKNQNGVLVDRTDRLIPDFLIPSSSRNVRCKDVTGDGWPDILEANTNGEDPRLFVNQGIVNGKWAGFVEAIDWFVSDIGTNDYEHFTTTGAPDGINSCTIDAADQDGDGSGDLLWVGTYFQLPIDRVLQLDASGLFLDVTATILSSSVQTFLNATQLPTTGVCFADMNQDGHDDLVQMKVGWLSIFYWDDAQQKFDHAQHLINGAVGPYMSTVGDFNNDGWPDIYVTSDAIDAVFYSRGTLSTYVIDTTSVNVPESFGIGGNTLVTDLDLDGWQDVMVADRDNFGANLCGSAGFLKAFRNLNTVVGQEIAPADPNLPGNYQSWHVVNTHAMGVLDIDRDGKMDFIAGSCRGIKVAMQIDCP